MQAPPWTLRFGWTYTKLYAGKRSPLCAQEFSICTSKCCPTGGQGDAQHSGFKQRYTPTGFSWITRQISRLPESRPDPCMTALGTSADSCTPGCSWRSASSNLRPQLPIDGWKRYDYRLVLPRDSRVNPLVPWLDGIGRGHYIPLFNPLSANYSRVLNEISIARKT